MFLAPVDPDWSLFIEVLASPKQKDVAIHLFSKMLTTGSTLKSLFHDVTKHVQHQHIYCKNIPPYFFHYVLR